MSDSIKDPVSGYQDNEITISYAFKLIDRQRKKIIIGVLISMITTLVYALTLPNIYRSNGIYEVSGSGETSSHVQKSGLSSIAGAVGVSLGGGQTNKGDIIVETIRSKTFLEHLLKFDDILPSLVAAESYNIGLDSLNFDESIYSSQNKTWLSSAPSVHEAYKVYSRQLSVYQDQGDNFIYISFDHISPRFAHEFITLIIDELNLSLRKKSLSEANAALDFLESQLTNTFLIELRNSISSLIQKQLEKKMLADVSKNFALKAIESPFIEEEKFSPSRALMLLWYSIGSFISLCMLALFWEANRSQSNEA
tara:strand:- start:182 stop:1108 length:927 start_codon:yes stop_codon:yes gene_type:complete